VWLRDRGWAGRLLGRWNMMFTATARSGTPFTARVLGNQANVAGTGSVGSGRADATGIPVTAGDGFFHRDAFTLPPSSRFGNAGRNTIPGLTFFTLGASFGRSFPIGDRRRIELRVSSENLANHVNYVGLSTIVNSLTYGQPTAAGNMRTISMNVRLQF
jgi:hypothetical protein